MKNLSLLSAAGEYTHLKPLLEAWLSTVDHYCTLHRKFELQENCWWHNERASISILAGAAWRVPDKRGQWAAIEEFATHKRGLVEQGHVEGDTRYGRCDLYITNSKVSYAIEAKQAWQSIGDRSSGLVNVRAGLETAWKDAGTLHSNEADQRMAVTFIVPFIPVSEVRKEGKVDPDGVRDKVEAWLKNMEPFERVKGKSTAYAYYFPYQCGDYLNEVVGRLFPGLVMVLERRLRGK
ncbi:hypothetical protein [Billgrantia kenyensis]|uniref:Uncharacterized protein n=1 Tax=Billgrantia kenyensis TaxID=321266 RepID=A0A7V9W4Z7_9GAMM|nr:hypothetical protein [Halomonas kenyensis]MBA2781107.1 hypothetical protein [Halomonas kenyensis]MCG6663820.1 hypothetical protein [Halomonas kenyensis]